MWHPTALLTFVNPPARHILYGICAHSWGKEPLEEATAITKANVGKWLHGVSMYGVWILLHFLETVEMLFHTISLITSFDLRGRDSPTVSVLLRNLIANFII